MNKTMWSQPHEKKILLCKKYNNFDSIENADQIILDRYERNTMKTEE